MVKNSCIWGNCELRKKRVLSWQSPSYLGWFPAAFWVISSWATKRQVLIGLPVSNFSHASPWKAFLSESSSRELGELLPWLSITCWPQGWGCALWCSSVARAKPLLWLLNVGCHFTPASVASSLIFPEIAINVSGLSVSLLHHINDSHSALVRVGWGSIFLPIKKSKCYQLADQLQFHGLWSPGKGN